MKIRVNVWFVLAFVAATRFLYNVVVAQTMPKSAPIIVTNTNDVMGGKSPAIPAFPKLTRKPGYLRGSVRDSAGRPLEGAHIMVIPAALFGSSRTSQAIKGRTDANGFYEIALPVGGCRVWCAGYAVTVNGVRLALPLHPADGELDTLDKDRGDIENFVLLSYGIANPSTVSENPVYCRGYYGASFTIGYNLSDPTDSVVPPGNLPEGAEVEITLTPDGALMDGSQGHTLVVRKTLKNSSYFQVNDVPIGRYRIWARLLNHGNAEPLRLKDNGRSAAQGGMEPKETEETATIIFRSESGDPSVLRVPNGNMERLSLLVKRIGKGGSR